MNKKQIVWEDKGSLELWRIDSVALDNVVEEFKKLIATVSARFSLEKESSIRIAQHDVPYEYDAKDWYVQVSRLETDEELSNRLRNEKNAKEMQEHWDREQYEKLKKKFEVQQ